jgi:predicted RNA methylase
MTLTWRVIDDLGILDSVTRTARAMPREKKTKKLTFVDAFAGCGGLSLGLLQAGLEGCFAIEHDKFAFETLKANLLHAQNKFKFKWPRWLRCDGPILRHFL